MRQNKVETELRSELRINQMDIKLKQLRKIVKERLETKRLIKSRLRFRLRSPKY